MSSSGTVAPGSVVARPPRRRLPSSLRGFAQALPFLSPALILVGAFLIVPVVWTVLLSLNRTRGLNFGDEWIGLDNYERLLTRDSRFLDTDEFPWAGAVINNLRWVIFYTGLCLLLGLVTAVLATRVNYERAFKAIIFVPMAISATAVAIIWLLVYSPDPQIGVLNALIGAVGGNPVSWTGRRDTVNYAIIVAYVWASTGFVMVVLSAALKGISEEVIEAARTDGATEWDIFRRIQLPLLSLPISVVAVWLIINVIKIFDIVYIMTKGGPGGASRVIGYSYYVETFENGKGGYGAAVAVIMLLLIIPIMAFNIRRFRSEAIQG